MAMMIATVTITTTTITVLLIGFDQRSPLRFQSDAAWAASARRQRPARSKLRVGRCPLRVTARLSAQPASAASENANQRRTS
jgi:hypothetical protein